MSEWISVEERLPQSRQIVDVLYGGERIINMKYTKTYGFQANYSDPKTPHPRPAYFIGGLVTHWMPIPETPNE